MKVENIKPSDRINQIFRDMFRSVFSSFEKLNEKRQKTLERRQKLASYEEIYDEDLDSHNQKALRQT